MLASGGRAGRWLGPLGERQTPAAWTVQLALEVVGSRGLMWSQLYY
jgi:hypothetical protein